MTSPQRGVENGAAPTPSIKASRRPPLCAPRSSRSPAQAEGLALAMDFGLLYDKDLRLFHIGYNVTADRLDSHHYDLLASEARLASLFAIAKGDAPVEHWFHLGRATTVDRARIAACSRGAARCSST